MYFNLKLFLLLCVSFFASICSAEDGGFRNERACFIKYLKSKGRLDADYESIPGSQCGSLIPLMVRVSKIDASDRIKMMNPDKADCLIEEFHRRHAIDHIIKIIVLVTESETEKDTQLVETRQLFKEDLENIAVQCQTDGKDFVKTFYFNLGIKNDTLEAHQYQYCLAKYSVDNGFLELNGVITNPHNIDTESVDCEKIVNAEINKKEREFSEKYPPKSSDCILNIYKSSQLFGWETAYMILDYLDVTDGEKRVQANKYGDKVGEYFENVKNTCDVSGIPEFRDH